MAGSITDVPPPQPPRIEDSGQAPNTRVVPPRAVSASETPSPEAASANAAANASASAARDFGIGRVISASA
jgi:hypothetical protein